MSEHPDFWTRYQPGTRDTDAREGTPRFFQDIARQRYQREPHILEIVQFDRWVNRDVLEVGCGIGTDGFRFAQAGARYTGVDFSDRAIQLARRRFSLGGARGELMTADAIDLPFANGSFDLVYSNGVIHHIEQTTAAIAEFYRVLRPGGRAVVMVYHRNSVNYWLGIMTLRRSLAGILLAPGGTRIVARITGEPVKVLEGHRELLHRHGLNYLRNRELFLSNNTDGPGNPLSKVYTRADMRAAFQQFSSVETAVRYLNARSVPGGRRFERRPIGIWLAKRMGWHLYVMATK